MLYKLQIATLLLWFVKEEAEPLERVKANKKNLINYGNMDFNSKN